MPLIPFVKTGYLGTNQWVPLVNGNGLTAGGGEPIQENVDPVELEDTTLPEEVPEP